MTTTHCLVVFGPTLCVVAAMAFGFGLAIRTPPRG